VDISVVVPIYNDASLARDFIVETQKVLSTSGSFEIIFVDDGSRNDSMKILKTLQEEFSFVRVIGLSRNFGQHIAISAGYQFAKGKYIAYLNVDREDPPDQIPMMLEKMKTSGCDIVLGVYTKRNVSFIHQLSSYGFQWVLNSLTGANVPLNISTLRVANRKFIDAYNSLKERQRYIPGLEIWLGFKHEYVPVRHQKRTEGKSSYNWRRRWKMAIETILSFSDLPLRTVSIMGLIISLLGVVLVASVILEKYIGINYLPGYASLISAIVLLSGIQIFVTGVSGLYIGRILAETQGRPLFVVRDKLGFD
jgi:glycosyltransferase involved in cell wall biosynthesis